MCINIILIKPNTEGQLHTIVIPLPYLYYPCIPTLTNGEGDGDHLNVKYVPHICIYIYMFPETGAKPNAKTKSSCRTSSSCSRSAKARACWRWRYQIPTCNLRLICCTLQWRMCKINRLTLLTANIASANSLTLLYIAAVFLHNHITTCHFFSIQRFC